MAMAAAIKAATMMSPGGSKASQELNRNHAQLSNKEADNMAVSHISAKAASIRVDMVGSRADTRMASMASRGGMDTQDRRRLLPVYNRLSRGLR